LVSKISILISHLSIAVGISFSNNENQGVAGGAADNLAHAKLLEETKEEEFVLGPPSVVPKLTPTFFLCR
jgi:hypothetical protein